MTGDKKALIYLTGSDFFTFVYFYPRNVDLAFMLFLATDLLLLILLSTMQAWEFHIYKPVLLAADQFCWHKT